MHDSHSTGETLFLRGTRREKKWMVITDERPTAGECPRATSLQRIHKRPAYSPGHSQLCIYADDLSVTAQSTDFAPIEETLTALDGLSEYYTTNQLRANPTKTQVSFFHLRLVTWYVSIVGNKDTHGLNSKRLAEVWMDDYKRLFYAHRRDMQVSHVTSAYISPAQSVNTAKSHL